MTDSAYRKTSLPSKLNLSNRNTRDQLNESQDDRRGELEGSSSTVAKQSDKACVDVMRQDLRDWLKDHDITGPPPSAEAEGRAMWAWMRDFHKENNDDWFTRNMPRLHERFKPIFVDEMKKMKAEVAARNLAAAPPAAPAATAGGSGADLLDFGGPAPAAPPPAAAAPAAASGGALDLFDLGSASPAPVAPAALAVSPAPAVSDLGDLYPSPLPAPQAAAPQMPAQFDLYAAPQVAAPQAPANNGLDGLLDFGSPAIAPAPNMSLDPLAAMSAPAPNVSLDPLATVSAPAPNVSLDPFATVSAPASNVSLDPFAAADIGVAPKPKQDGNLLDFAF